MNPWFSHGMPRFSPGRRLSSVVGFVPIGVFPQVWSASIGITPDPDLPFYVVPRINANLVVTLHPVSVLVMSGYPDTLPPFRDPFPVSLPMA